MAEKKATTKKAATKKTAAKKTVAKKTAAKKSTAKNDAAKDDELVELPQPTNDRSSSPHEDSVDKVQVSVGHGAPAAKLTPLEVAKLLDAGSRRWGTGRERDNALVAEGYDLNDLRLKQREVRAQRLADNG